MIKTEGLISSYQECCQLSPQLSALFGNCPWQKRATSPKVIDSPQSACIRRLVTMKVTRPKRLDPRSSQPESSLWGWLRTLFSLNHSPASLSAQSCFFHFLNGLESSFLRNPTRNTCYILYYT